jgi:hypothetical protein
VDEHLGDHEISDLDLFDPRKRRAVVAVAVRIDSVADRILRARVDGGVVVVAIVDAREAVLVRVERRNARIVGGRVVALGAGIVARNVISAAPGVVASAGSDESIRRRVQMLAREHAEKNHPHHTPPSHSATAARAISRRRSDLQDREGVAPLRLAGGP